MAGLRVGIHGTQPFRTFAHSRWRDYRIQPFLPVSGIQYEVQKRFRKRFLQRVKDISCKACVSDRTLFEAYTLK